MMKQKRSEVLTKKIFLRELKKLATKDELKKLATKDELKKLSQRMDSFEKSMKNEFSAHKIAMELRIDNLEDRIKGYLFEFKSEILGAVSEAMSRTQKLDDENEILTDRTYESVRRLDNHEERIKFLEQAAV